MGWRQEKTLNDGDHDMEDTLLRKSLELGRTRLSITNQLTVARQKLEVALLHSVGGGTFRLDYPFLSFVGLLVSLNKTSAVLLDSRNNPFMIEELPKFLEDILAVYAEATNTYHIETARIRDARSVAEATQYE